MKLHKTIALLIAVSIIITATIALRNMQSQEGTTTITAQVSTPPVINSITLYDDDDGGTTTSTDWLTPMDEMTLLINISDPDIDQGDYISYISVTFYYGSPEPSNLAPDIKVVYNLTRSSASDPGSWNISDGLPTGSQYDPYRWLVDSVNSSIVEDAASNTAIVKLVFTPSKIARYSSSSDWTISVLVRDGYGGEATSSVTKNCQFFVEISLTTTDGDTSINVLVGPDGQPYLVDENIIVDVTANDDFKLQFMANNWSATVDLNTLQIWIDDDNNWDDDTGNLQKQQVADTYVPSTGWGTWSRTLWDGMSISKPTINLYVFIVALSTVSPGSYTTTLYIKIYH